jgi:hypothetical protein
LFDDDKKAIGVEYQSNPKFCKSPMENKCARHLKLIADIHSSAQPRIHDG